MALMAYQLCPQALVQQSPKVLLCPCVGPPVPKMPAAVHHLDSKALPLICLLLKASFQVLRARQGFQGCVPQPLAVQNT